MKEMWKDFPPPIRPLSSFGNHWVQRARAMQRGQGRYRRVPEEALIAQFIPNGAPTALYDIGVGPRSEFLTLKLIYPDLEVFGCEPHAEEVEELKSIFPGRLVQCAIGSNSGLGILYKSKLGLGGSSLKSGRGVTDEAPVDIWTLDDFDAWAGRKDRILLWMDIEDGELDALQSGHNLLRSGRVEWLNIETRDVPGHEGSPSTKDIVDFLHPYGYVPIERYNVQGPYPEAPGDVIFFKVGVVPLIKGSYPVGIQYKKGKE